MGIPTKDLKKIKEMEVVLGNRSDNTLMDGFIWVKKGRGTEVLKFTSVGEVRKFIQKVRDGDAKLA